MSKLLHVLVLSLALLGMASLARADFAEVSGPGEEPFLAFKQAAWTWEDLAGQGLTSITYAVHRSTLPDQGFVPVRDGYLAPSWDGDPALPSDEGVELFHYLITANDQTGDSGAGETSETDPRVVNFPERCREGRAPIQDVVPIRMEEHPDNFFGPTFLTHEPSRPDDDFVVQRNGDVYIRRAGDFVLPAFLDITGRVRTGGERGLLGFAFHPDFETNGRVFVHYSSSGITDCGVLDNNHCAVVSEFTLSADNDLVDPGSERVLLIFGQPDSNHNGGWIGFSPIDGDRLYIALGDGGGQRNQFDTAEDPTLLLGSILRIEPEPDAGPGTEYTIPADNPFVGHPVNRPEIFAWGYRNPWRCSFDRETGDFYVADVGQDGWEEVNVALASEGGGNGLNHGWPVMEGNDCHAPAMGCDMTGLTLPAVDYAHGGGGFCSGSITGGYVYRGCNMSFLHGTYFFSDWCQGGVSTFRHADGPVASFEHIRADLNGPNAIVTFGEDSDGELWLLDGGGTAWRLRPDF